MANETAVQLSDDFVYNGVLSSDVIFEPATGTPALSDMFGTIIPDIKYSTKLNLSPVLQNIVKAAGGATADCALPVSNGVQFSNRDITVDGMGFRVPWCKDDFENAANQYLGQLYLKNGLEGYEPSTEIEGWINTLLENGLRLDTFRIASFGDKTSASTDYDMTDGFWTKAIAGEGSVTQQIGTPFGASITDGGALASLTALYDGAPIRLKMLPASEKMFYCTGSVFENYRKSLQKVENGTSPTQYEIQVNGVTGLTFNGITLLPVYAWDEALLDPNNPLFNINPHLVVYMSKANNALAIDGTSDLGGVDGFFDKKDRKAYFDAFFKMGFNFILDDLTVYNTGAAKP